jgi:acyl carrier protein
VSVLHDALIRAIGEWNPALDGSVKRETPLLSSGRLDSMGLFQLVMWIEQQAGRAIDATTVDMAAQWDTVDAIVAFVERERGRR